MNNFDIWNETKNEIPIVVSIPHSGTYLPKEMKDNLADNIILANMDWYLPKLYNFLQDLGITTIINNISRYVIDPNREISNSKNDSYIKNYVYTKTTFNYEMYKKSLDSIEIDNRLENYYIPYHKAIFNALNNKLTQFNKIYLIDLHSFGKDIEENIVLGNRNEQTASFEFTNLVKNSLESQGFKISLNKPYSGGYIIRKYATDNVETVQIELSYKKYIENRIFGNEEFPKINTDLFNETQEKLKHFFKDLIDKI